MFAKSFYNSKRWKFVRNAYVQSRFGICERCGAPNSKQVHHKIWLDEVNINDPDISLNFDNLELLCDTCHQNEHHCFGSATIEGLSFDASGMLVKRQ